MIKQNTETINKIRYLLLTEWDPLNIGDNPNLFDEYDGYIPIVLSILMKGIGVEELSILLYKIEQEEIGVDGNLEKCYRVAVALKNMNS
jgi:hypothetical protein